MKKIELHVHLDGSIRVSTVSELLNISYEEAKAKMVGKSLNSLDEYLTRFDLPIKIMQTKENLKRVAYELALDLIKDEVIYAEVRFAPIFHTSILSLEEVCKAVLEGFDLVKDKIKINLILCMMRHLSLDDNLKIVDLYNKHIDSRIVALDLAGSELLYPNELFIDLFNKINQDNIPFTIHSGEVNNIDNIKYAINFKANRIGHGIAVIHDEFYLNQLLHKDILLEICPTSNVDTFSVTDYSLHPVKELFDKGISINISTDDRTVSDITLEKEYEKLKNIFDFTDDDFIKMNIDSINHAFILEKEKMELIDMIKA